MAEVENIRDIFTFTYHMLTHEKRTLDDIQVDWFNPDSLAKINETFKAFYQKEVPPELADWLQSPEAAELIVREIEKARENFLQHLSQCGVHHRYVEEIGHVTPSENIQYLHQESKSAFNSPQGFTQKGQLITLDKDYDPTIRHIRITEGVLFAIMENMATLPAFQHYSQDKLLILALRQVVYHELGHSLQQAFENFNGKLQVGFTTIPSVRGKKLEDYGSHFFQNKNKNLASLDETMVSEKIVEGMANDFLAWDIMEDPDFTKPEQDRRTIDYWLRRKSFSTEPITQDKGFQNLKFLTRLIGMHAKDVDYTLLKFRLRKILDQYPDLQQRMAKLDIPYARGLLMPYSPRALRRFYDILGKEPTEPVPVRIPAQT